MEPTGFELYSWNFKGSPLKHGPGKEDYITNFPLVGKVTFQGREPLKLPKGVYTPQKLTCIPKMMLSKWWLLFKYVLVWYLCWISVVCIISLFQMCVWLIGKGKRTEPDLFSIWGLGIGYHQLSFKALVAGSGIPGERKSWRLQLKRFIEKYVPWEPTTFTFRGYNPYVGGVKPSFFMVLGSKGRWFIAWKKNKTTRRSCKRKWRLVVSKMGGGKPIFSIFTRTWGNDPSWRAYFSNGLKPPTR